MTQHHKTIPQKIVLHRPLRYYGEYHPKMGRRAAEPALAPVKQPVKRTITLPKISAEAVVNLVLTAVYPKGIPVADIHLVSDWVSATNQFIEGMSS